MTSKKSYPLFSAVIAILLIASVSLSGCLNTDDPADEHDHGHGDQNAAYDPLDNASVHQIVNGSKILVAASVVPQTEFIEKIGGDNVIAISMIPSGAGHTYDPSPRQLEDLSKADLYMQLGSGEPFETDNMPTFKELNPNMTVINSSKGIALIQGDSHIWTSPKAAMTMAENTYKGLVSVDASNESYYRANADACIQELEALDAELTTDLSGLKSRHFMVYHPAWGYFARDYNLTQIAIEVDGKEPAPQDVVNFIGIAKDNNVSVIFVQEQVSVSGASAIAEGVGGSVYVLDPLAKNYIENMREVGHALADKMS
ncbi:MAG: zinc ABC transporter substrate-binding protein [Methanosarcinales archaeon]|jgi:zinc transport system substrate-binding protein|nr:zinc ABC transporter substrate-binding protein [Methanosarcinales archaeon]